MIIKTDNQNYTNIAAAIREKNGKTDKYKPSEMAIAIEAIDTKGIYCTLTITTTAGATVTATLSGTTVTAKANSSGIAVLELPKDGTWTVTATADGQSVSIQVNTAFSIKTALQFFPAEPSSYEYMALVTASQTWTAPEDGYFQIEVFGASGKGGAADFNAASMGATGASGGGGGGGGYACSRVKLKKGDTVVIVRGAVGATSSATINSTLESYSTVSVTSGENGGDADCSRSNINASNVDAGTGGAGGTAYGGNYSNKSGNDGSTGGKDKVRRDEGPTTIAGGAGGSSGYTGGNAGGAGGKVRIIGWEKAESQEIDNMIYSASSGKAGFIKIYRGNTNLA